MKKGDRFAECVVTSISYLNNAAVIKINEEMWKWVPTSNKLQLVSFGWQTSETNGFNTNSMDVEEEKGFVGTLGKVKAFVFKQTV